MKKFTIFLALLLVVAMPMMAERVTPKTACKVAATFLNNNGAKTAQLTNLSKEAGFPNLYIFNGNPGFVVMAADDCVQPILGYSLSGTFIVEDMPDNVRGWLQGYNDEIQYAVNSKMSATTETAKLWKDLAEGNSKAAKVNEVVAPLIQTKWNQTKYYNNLCPAVSDGPEGRANTGCVATAMAQIMYYWQYPSHGIGSHSYTWHGQTLSADFGATTYDWDNMQLYYNYYYPTGTGEATWISAPDQTQLSAVSTLMYHCGVSVDMVYGGHSTGGSSASTANVGAALKTYFNYSPDIEYKKKSDYNSEWITMVKAELDESRPLQYRGSSSGGGHSFICDGYNDADYFHFNWGWSGAYDGYFSLDNLDTGANNQSGQGNGDYTDNQAALFGIQPVQCAAAEPTNLTYTLSGLQGLTLNWNEANGAVSYNIYRNGNLVGTSATTTYQETAPFGTNVYYVRSVDNAGILSLSSNPVSIFVGYQQPVVDDLEATLDGNNVSLTWMAPDWCYPETESAILNYGQGNLYYLWTSVYYAHRHLAANLAQYAGKAVYKVSTYIKYPGTYSVYIYTKSTQDDEPDPNSLAFSNTGVAVTISNGWYEFDADGPIILSGTDDLWVVIKQENTGQNFATPSFNLTTFNENACYSGSSPTSLSSLHMIQGEEFMISWLINVYLTDGNYTYNLYQDGIEIAHDLTQTTYNNASLNDDAANLFTVKTNYYGGKTEASNKIGFTKGNTSLETLEMTANDKMTITEGSKLTVSGTLSNDNPENLILENGAQLIHSSEDVQATVLKNIVPYTSDNNGWNFIASPVTENTIPSESNGFLNGTPGQNNNTYDLYYYDEPNQLWKNYENQSFVIENKKGYLYANGETNGTTLKFAGTLLPSNESITINNLSHSATTLNGFNLVGNPFACNATINQDGYVIEGNQVMLANGTKVFAPCEGAFVKATFSNNYAVTFSQYTGAKAFGKDNCLDLVITQGKATTDRARVRFGGGIGLEKFSLDDQHSQISLWQNGQEYAVAYADGVSEMPISFKAAENGTYTLILSATLNSQLSTLNFNYLHLIDNMMGEDVDLLATPSYTFESKTTDYTSRFRLLFAPKEDGASTGSATFAYYANGEIIITGIADACNASLQVVDMMGRIVLVGDAINRVSTSGITPGVYVLRLIDGETIRTQKIVIE